MIKKYTCSTFQSIGRSFSRRSFSQVSRNDIDLATRIENHEFHSEIYVYPPPRLYQENFIEFDNEILQTFEFQNDSQIYIHIPFCEQLCNYCGYVKMVPKNEDMIDEYVSCVITEIELYEDVLRGKEVSTLHIGGGTPSLLKTSDFEKIFSTLENVNPGIVSNCQEVSIESTPSLITNSKISDLKDLGFNRVSLGIQSFNVHEIELTNRTKNLPESSEMALEILKGNEIENIVVDLMIGLEYQTVDSFMSSVRNLLSSDSVRPDTVELYALGIIEWTKFGKRKQTSKFMSSEDIYECYSLAREIFMSSGYEQACHNRYELATGSFLQEDFVFNNVDLIGFGAGTRTYLQDVHYRNTFHPKDHVRSIEEYMDSMKQQKLCIGSGVVLSEEEKMRQFCIYNIEDFDGGEFEKKFGCSPFSVDDFRSIFEQMKTCELLDDGARIDGEEVKFKLNDKGLTYRDLVGRQFYSSAANEVENLYRPSNKSIRKQGC